MSIKISIVLIFIVVLCFSASCRALLDVVTCESAVANDKCSSIDYSSISFAVVVGIGGFLNHDQDGSWRYYATINITNNGGESINLTQIGTTILNVTYVDDDFEMWDITGNLTANQIIDSNSTFQANWTITNAGFFKEPKTIWVRLDVYLAGVDHPLTDIFVIPEFPSLLVLTPLLILTLLATIAYRKKRGTEFHLRFLNSFNPSTSQM